MGFIPPRAVRKVIAKPKEEWTEADKELIRICNKGTQFKSDNFPYYAPFLGMLGNLF